MAPVALIFSTKQKFSRKHAMTLGYEIRFDAHSLADRDFGGECAGVHRRRDIADPDTCFLRCLARRRCRRPGRYDDWLLPRGAKQSRLARPQFFTFAGKGFDWLQNRKSTRLNSSHSSISY